MRRTLPAAVTLAFFAGAIVGRATSPPTPPDMSEWVVTGLSMRGVVSDQPDPDDYEAYVLRPDLTTVRFPVSRTVAVVYAAGARLSAKTIMPAP